jgi:UDP-GlcNAc3NAcA epimerase
LIEASKEYSWKTILPLHPRTLKMIQTFAQEDPFFSNLSDLQIIPPVSYLQMVLLESECGMVITDSGGVQKEAYFYEKPCIVLRPETEWVELVESGAAILVDADKTKLLASISTFEKSKYPASAGFYGDGKAAELICRTILEVLS